MHMWKFFRKIKSENLWKSIENPPEYGKKVMVRCQDGDINLGWLDEGRKIWITFILTVDKKETVFQIVNPKEWREIPI